MQPPNKKQPLICCYTGNDHANSNAKGHCHRSLQNTLEGCKCNGMLIAFCFAPAVKPECKQACSRRTGKKQNTFYPHSPAPAACIFIAAQSSFVSVPDMTQQVPKSCKGCQIAFLHPLSCICTAIAGKKHRF